MTLGRGTATAQLWFVCFLFFVCEFFGGGDVRGGKTELLSLPIVPSFHGASYITQSHLET